jgi:uncharacterized protein YndB with AHSA1/START domain
MNSLQKNEIVSSRLFATGRERLYEAFSDAQQLAHWWGPKGFTNTFEEFDLRPGGAWRFTMHAPTGAEYHNVSEFVEVQKPERIVFEHLRPVHRFIMTMIFTEEEGGTRLTWRMQFESPAEVERLGDFLKSANEENFDRLEALLSKPELGPEIPHA